jgi:predicted nuclease of predicted toxin-antitoxin system
MRFLLDQNFDRRLLHPLREHRHDVAVVGIDYPAGLPDPEVLAIALREQRVLLTNDRDFGELVVGEGLPHAGIIYLRMRRRSAAAKWERLDYVLKQYGDQLSGFLVVTEDAVRVR